MTRNAVRAAAVACWLLLLGGVSLIAVDPGRGWIGALAVITALLGGLPALAWLRRGQQPEDGWASMNDRPECPHGCGHGEDGGTS